MLSLLAWIDFRRYFTFLQRPHAQAASSQWLETLICVSTSAVHSYHISRYHELTLLLYFIIKQPSPTCSLLREALFYEDSVPHPFFSPVPVNIANSVLHNFHWLMVIPTYVASIHLYFTGAARTRTTLPIHRNLQHHSTPCQWHRPPCQWHRPPWLISWIKRKRFWQVKLRVLLTLFPGDALANRATWKYVYSTVTCSYVTSRKEGKRRYM